MDCQAVPVNCLMSKVALIALWFLFPIKVINFKADLKLGDINYNNITASRWNPKFMHKLDHLLAGQRWERDPLVSNIVKLADARQETSTPNQ